MVNIHYYWFRVKLYMIAAQYQDIHEITFSVKQGRKTQNKIIIFENRVFLQALLHFREMRELCFFFFSHVSFEILQPNFMCYGIKIGLGKRFFE